MTMERRQKRKRYCAAQECTSTWSDMAWQQWNFYQQIMSNSNKLPHKGKCTIPKSRIPHIKKSKSCFKPFFFNLIEITMITDRLKKWPKTPDLFSFCLKLPMMLCEDIPQLRVAPPSSRWNSLCKSFPWKNSRLHRPSTLFILHRMKSIFTQRICNKDKIANPVFLGKRINHRSTLLTQMFLHGKTCF